MLRPTRSLTASAALTAALAAALTATLPAAPAAAVPTTTIKPAALPRGADVAVPHLEGKVVVDGTVRIPVRAASVTLLGKSGSAYVVTTANGRGGRGKVVRLGADGTRVVLAKAPAYSTHLSDDGATVVSAQSGSATRSTVTVRSATTGEVLARRQLRGYVSVLDADGQQVLLGDPARTRVWGWSTGSLATVSRLGGQAGDLSSDVFSGYTSDPYEGGCTVVARISTGERLWRSCTERVQSFGPDGTRMTTIDLLADGVGPGYVAVRAVTGHRFGRYTVKDGWFGGIEFESAGAVLLEAHGKRKTAVVRCTDAGCERAGALSVSEPPRLAG